MKLLVYLFVFCVVAQAATAQSADEKQIRQLLDRQTKAWNRGNLEEFMEGYWQNDSLMFIGKSGVTYGYQNTLENYKTGYPDTAHMGKLTFNILHVKRVSSDAYFVVGKWFLKRSVGDAGGHYTLWFRKIKGKWQIVADHSS